MRSRSRCRGAAADNVAPRMRLLTLSSATALLQGKPIDHSITVVGYGTDPTNGPYWLIKVRCMMQVHVLARSVHSPPTGSDRTRGRRISPMAATSTSRAVRHRCFAATLTIC